MVRKMDSPPARVENVHSIAIPAMNPMIICAAQAFRMHRLSSIMPANAITPAIPVITLMVPEPPVSATPLMNAVNHTAPVPMPPLTAPPIAAAVHALMFVIPATPITAVFAAKMSQMAKSPATIVHPPVPLPVTPVITRVRMALNVIPIPPVTAVTATPNAKKKPVPRLHAPAESAFIHAAQVIPPMARFVAPMSPMVPSPATAVIPAHLHVNPVITRVQMALNVIPIPPVTAVKATPNVKKKPVPRFHAPAESAFIHAAQVIPPTARFVVPMSQMAPSQKLTMIPVHLHASPITIKPLPVRAVKSTAPAIAVPHMPFATSNTPPTAAHLPVPVHSPATAVM